MKRKMESVEVFSNGDGDIVIKNDVIGTDDCFVTFTLEQADLVCKWVMEVKEELEHQEESG